MLFIFILRSLTKSTVEFHTHPYHFATKFVSSVREPGYPVLKQNGRPGADGLNRKEKEKLLGYEYVYLPEKIYTYQKVKQSVIF